ncbi:fungal-specific transcription factor domain-containing protein [Lipomyces orientalis]|uniref:Fungal-specific transcription factor domain-containing protein n=1 Tax=Lipomyces orientalis TaxID=1233043 RepID=A0ACC3TRK5_9ASCO
MAILGRHNSTVTAVQHDLLRALWLKNCSRATESWHSLGNAIRQAQELGLHLQSEIRQSAEGNVGETLAGLWYDEYKRRLWVNLFIWDSHMALVLGRPRIINANDCTIKTPTDCDIPEDPSTTVPTSIGWDNVPSSYTPRLFIYAISHKIHKMRSLAADKPYISDYNVVKALHDQVMSLLNGLPPVFRRDNPDISWDSRCPHFPKQRQQISTAASSFLMALHRPHAAIHKFSREEGIRAALNTLECQQRLFEMVSRHHYKAFSFSFYTIDAAIFLAATMITHRPTDQRLLQNIYHSLRQAINRLLMMKDRSPIAKSGFQVLTQCYQKISSESSNNISGPINLNCTGHGVNEGREGATVPGQQNCIDRSLSNLPNLNSTIHIDGSTYSDTSSNATDFNASFWMQHVTEDIDVDLGALIHGSWDPLLLPNPENIG